MWVHQMMHKTKTIKAICAEAQISRATLYNWQSEFAVLAKEDADRERQTAASLSWQPNDKYKMLLSALMKTDADKTISRRLARELAKRYNLTTVQACALVNLQPDMYGHRPRKPEADDNDVYAALLHLLEEQNSRSLQDCIALLQVSQPGWTIRQIKRIYRQGRLYLKRTRIRRADSLPKKIISSFASAATPLQTLHEGAFWHIGLLEQQTSEETIWLLFVMNYTDGTPFHILTGRNEICEADIMKLIKTAAAQNGLPKKIRLPAAAPFAGSDMQKWCWQNRIAIHNLSMAKPENILEARYIQNDIKKQLLIDETITLEKLQIAADKWIEHFTKNSMAAINYFMKEPVVG